MILFVPTAKTPFSFAVNLQVNVNSVSWQCWWKEQSNSVDKFSGKRLKRWAAVLLVGFCLLLQVIALISCQLAKKGEYKNTVSIRTSYLSCTSNVTSLDSSKFAAYHYDPACSSCLKSISLKTRKYVSCAIKLLLKWLIFQSNLHVKRTWQPVKT